MSDSHVNNDVKTCLKVFPLLAFLVLVTVFVHQAHLPYKIQLIIEIVKVFIVIGYFIHLIANRQEVNNAWIITIIFVAGLLLLPIANALNHIHGTVDDSKKLQAETLTEQPAAAEGEERVH